MYSSLVVLLHIGDNYRDTSNVEFAEMLPQTVSSGGRYVNMYRHRALSAIMLDAICQLQLAGSPQPSKITPSYVNFN